MIILLLAMLLGFAPAQAESTIVKGPGVSRLEYSAYLKAAEGRTSPTQKYLNEHPSSAANEKLVQLLASAQRSFLSGTLPEARNRFTEALALRFEDDWSHIERTALQFSALRLAQLASSPSEQEMHLLTAMTFGEDLQPDRKLFPPPLLDKFELLKKTSTVPIQTAAWRKDFTMILLNGRAVNLHTTDEIRLRPRDYRVTFLSDTWAPQSFVTASEQIATLNVPTTPLYQGNCESHPTSEFFGAKCMNIDRGSQLMRVTSLPSHSIHPPEIPIVPSRPLYKNTWFWAGAGVVTAAVVLSLKKKSETSTSTTHGF